jgi:hypothetical protein
MISTLQLIPLLSAMPHGELLDWIDYVEYYYVSDWITDPNQQRKHRLSLHVRRVGLDTGNFPIQILPSKNIVQMRSRKQIQAAKIVAELGEVGQKTALVFAQAILQVKGGRYSQA